MSNNNTNNSFYGVAFIAGALLIQKWKTVIIAVVMMVTTIRANRNEMSNCDEVRQVYCGWCLVLLVVAAAVARHCLLMLAGA